MPLKETYSDTANFEEPQCERGAIPGKEVDGKTMFKNFIDAYHAEFKGDMTLTADEMKYFNTPFSIYGLSKLIDEVMLAKYQKAHGIRWVSLRYGNVCGADPEGNVGEAKKKPHTLMTLAIHTILGRRADFLSLFGTDYATPDGTTIRDYVHPSDLADAHLAAYKHLENGGESDIFNLGTGTGSSVREVIKAVEEASGKKIIVKEEPKRLGDTTLSTLSIEKAKAQLGYVPKFGLKEMAETAWKWHNELQDPEWQTGFKRRPPAAEPAAADTAGK